MKLFAMTIALWASFAIVHTMLALPRVKSALGRHISTYYSFFYTMITLAHLGIILACYVLVLEPGAYKFSPPFPIFLAQIVGVLVGAAIICAAVLQFGLFRFLGLVRDKNEVHAGKLIQSGVFRYIRHPINSGLMIVFWCKISNSVDVYTAVIITAYVLLTTPHVEKRLVAYFGDEYVRYRERTSAFLPFKR